MKVKSIVIFVFTLVMAITLSSCDLDDILNSVADFENDTSSTISKENSDINSTASQDSDSSIDSDKEINSTISSDEDSSADSGYESSGINENDTSSQQTGNFFDILFTMKCEENLIFSKYNVSFYLDNKYVGTINHGETESYNFQLEKGIHTINVYKENDLDVEGEFKIMVTESFNYEFELSCTSTKVNIKEMSNSTGSIEHESETARPLFYSTNDYETAQQGNTGVFSYRSEGGSYFIYWIIDFDEGYVYYFVEGNGNETCDRLKIESGDLNSRITITYHAGDEVWSEFLHFKYKNHPETLIWVDSDGFDYKFTTTDLDDALKLRDTKTITDY